MGGMQGNLCSHIISPSLVCFIQFQNNLVALLIPPTHISTETTKMGKSADSDPITSSTSRSSPSYTSQALALHNGMGGPHPSATQTVQPINVAGEITDMMPYRDNPPTRNARGSSSRRRPLPESSYGSSSSSGSGSSGAATPLQYSPTASSGHAQAQGLHMGMAWARPNHIQPVSLPALVTGFPVWLELISVETSTSDGGCSAIRGGKYALLWTRASRVGIMWALRALGRALYLYICNDMTYTVADKTYNILLHGCARRESTNRGINQWHFV
jgi:hypothetical protein